MTTYKLVEMRDKLDSPINVLLICLDLHAQFDDDQFSFHVCLVYFISTLGPILMNTSKRVKTSILFILKRMVPLELTHIIQGYHKHCKP